MMEYISSKENSKIKYVRKLISSSSFRRRERLFVAEGVRLCEDALRSGVEVTLALYSESFTDRAVDQFHLLSEVMGERCIVKDSIFSGLSDTKTPQGVLFVIKTLDKPADFDKINENGKILVLEDIADPSNLGTILRTAEAFAIDLVVMSENCCDLYSPKVIRGSMGAVFRQRVAVCDDLVSLIERFNRFGRSYAAVLSEDSQLLSDMRFSDFSLVCIGNEGRGLSDQVISACSDKLFIPMRGDAESLNAAVAASIILWEMIK